MRFFAFWGFIKMNILIVGNGFDLSHYLPTKYDHFMVAMEAIENWDVLKGDMNFDDLFGALYEKESYFFDKTKVIYKTENINLAVEQVEELQKKLKENVWYHYFSDHVKEVKTWIDFEVKIENALNTVNKFLNQVESSFEEFGDCNFPIHLIQNGEQKKVAEQYYLSLLECNHLMNLRLLAKNSNYGQHVDFWTDEKFAEIGSLWFISQEKPEYGFSKDMYLNFLVNQLDDFIFIFNLYLELIVSKLIENCSLSINLEARLVPDKIYSFNYTNTYQRIHKEVIVEYLHGSYGQDQNIVLGISDLDDDSLKKLKAYGFTKYHQKLFKDTDYLFLDEYKNNILENEDDILALKDELKGENRSNYRDDLNRRIRAKQNEGKLNLEITIWGHSLDISDKDYILDLFGLNDDIDRNVRVTVYYFNKTAKFSLLNNLLAILGKDKVEQWMKNKWLCFKPNPEIKFFAQESPDVDQAS